MSTDDIDPADEPAADAPAARRGGRPANARHRAPVRPEPVREAARQGGEPRLTRRRRRTENPFSLTDDILADMQGRGVTYEWKRASCFGQPDPDHAVNLRENGWTPVPADRYPQLMPDGHKGPVEKSGQVLMERPKYLTDEARQEDYAIARQQVSGKEQQIRSGDTPDGQLTRSHPSVSKVTRLNRSMERLEIPTE